LVQASFNKLKCVLKLVRRQKRRIYPIWKWMKVC
jgi:hypothetical protein